MKKKIRSSRRGLTFSMNENENFQIGRKFQYLINGNEIIILPSDKGNTISKKKVNETEKALFDIRSKSVKEFLQKADFFTVDITDSEIRVSCLQKVIAFQKRNKVSVSDILECNTIGTIVVPKEMCMAAGGEVYQQISISDYLTSMSKIDTVAGVSEIKQINKDMKDIFDVVSLFSGCGMLDYPFAKDDAFRVKFALDYESSACDSYKINIGDHITCGSIQDFSSNDIPDMDVIVGGPSCKAHSNANRAKRLDEHADVNLIDEYIRIVQEKKPSVFAIENVPAFLTAKDGEFLERVLTKLSNYEITSQIVTDCYLGGYTIRKRAIIIGSLVGKIQMPDIKILPLKTVKEALNKVDSTWFNYADLSKTSKQTKERMAMVPIGGNFKNIPELAHYDSHSNRYRRLDPDKPGITLTNWRKLPLIHPYEDRGITVAEAIALSGFEKDFRVIGTLPQRQQQIGNGVPFCIGNTLKNVIKKALVSYQPITV